MKGGPPPQLNYSLEAFFGPKNRVIADILRCNKCLFSLLSIRWRGPTPQLTIKLVSLEVGRCPAPGCSLSLHL